MDGASAMDAVDDHGADNNATAGASELMEILMDDDELETMSDLAVPVAAQISHSQIIEKQAQSIAKLEKQAAKAHEYKTLTKVKLKEAAARLREYRLRVEALSQELEALKKQKQTQTNDADDGKLVAAGRGKGGRGRGRGRGGRGRGRVAAVAGDVDAAVERKMVDVVSVAVQTDDERVQTSSIATQCDVEIDDEKLTRDAETQTPLGVVAYTQSLPVSADAVALPAHTATSDAAVRTHAEVKESVTSSVQTTVMGDVQPVRAIPKTATCEVQTTITGEIQPVRQGTRVSSGFQTDPVASASFCCQCDLLLPAEKDEEKTKKDIDIVENGLAKTIRSEEEDTIPDLKAGVSRKRKRSFESIGRGDKPTPSALLASVTQVSGSRIVAPVAQQRNGPLSTSTIANDAAASMLDKDAFLNTIATRQAEAEESNVSDVTDTARLVKSQSPLATLVNTASAVPAEKAPIQEAQHRKSESRAPAERPVGSLLQPMMVEFPEISPDRSPQENAHLESTQNRVDAISAAIDAELEFSDSDEDDTKRPGGDGASHSMQTAQSTTAAPDGVSSCTVVAFDAAICNEIDKELDFSSSDDDDIDDGASSSSSDDDDGAGIQDADLRPSGVTGAGSIVGKMDAVSAAIDDELASISDEEEEDKPQQDSTLHVTALTSRSDVVNHDAISAAIDDELASSSEEEEDNPRDGVSPTSNAVAGNAVTAVIDGELATKRDEKEDYKPTDALSTTRVVDADHNNDIAAAIDNELASSSDGEDTDSEEVVPDSEGRASVQDDAAAVKVGIEVASKSDSKDTQLAISNPELQTLNAVVPVDKDISALIDDELASSSDEEDERDAAIEPTEKAMPPKHDDAVDTALVKVTEDAVGGTLEKGSVIQSGAALAISRVPELEVQDDIAINGGKVVMPEENGCDETKVAQSSVIEAVVGEDTEAVVSLYEMATRKLDASGSTASHRRTVAAQTVEDGAVRQNLSRLSPDAHVLANGQADVETRIRTEMTYSDTEKDTRSVSNGTLKSDDRGKPSLSESSSGDSSDSDSSSESEHHDEDNGMDDIADEMETDMVSGIRQSNQSIQATVAEDSGDVAGEVNHDKEVPTGNIQVTGESKSMVTVAKLTAAQLALAAKRAVKAPSVSLMKDPMHQDAAAQAVKPVVHKRKRTRNESIGDKSDSGRSAKTKSDIEIEIAENSLNAPKSPVENTLSVDNDPCACGNEASERDQHPKKRLKLDDGDAAISSSLIVASSEGGTTNMTDAEPIAKDAKPSPEKLRTATDMQKDRLAKRISAFKRDMMRAENKKDEKFDDQFVFKTLRLLLTSCAKYAASQPEIVTALCDALVAHYRQKKVSPVVFIHGTCRVLRTPTTRGQVSETESPGVSRLAHHVLLGLVGSEVGDRDSIAQVSEADRYLLEECLDYLQTLLSASPATQIEYAVCSLSETNSKTQLQMMHLLRKNKVSKDKVYLGHVCTLYARICKSIDLNERLRILAFDLLRRNPNIKGLYFTRTIVEVAPEVLQVEYDSRGHKKSVIVKDAMQHVLAVIEAQSARKEEVFYGESSLEIMHHILECIDELSQQEINVEDPAYRRAFADKLWNTYITPRGVATWDDDTTFQVCKSLELLAAVYGMEHMVELFPLRRFLDACASSDDNKVKARIATMVGHIACTFAGILQSKGKNNTSDGSAAATNDSAAEFVAQTAAWLQQELSPESTAAPLHLEFQQVCASVCIDLIMAAAMELSRRRDILRTVVGWFQNQPQEQQMRFPANFLRQLRLLTVASRPLSASVTVMAKKGPKIAR
ncbi:hypothetical protein FI667_g76, partial [Globisporangium splendens]